MRKIILTFLMTLVVLSTYGQVRTETSHNGKYRAEAYYNDNGTKHIHDDVSDYIRIFEDGQLIEEINTKVLQRNDEPPITHMFFNIDDKILYFHGGKSSFEYNLITKEMSQLFKGQIIVIKGLDRDNKSVILCMNTKQFSNGEWEYGTIITKQSTSMLKKWEYDKYARYIDGVLYPLEEGEIFVQDYAKNEVYVEKH